MSPYDWCLVLGVGALTVLLVRHASRYDADRAEWQRTAADAADIDMTDAAARAEIAQLEAWLRIKPQPKNVIPHQTRRTEEDQ